MSRPAVYLPDAEDDIAAAHIHYERQRAGLGDDHVVRTQYAAGEKVSHRLERRDRWSSTWG